MGFLAWHRYFLHHFETALRDECHYNGSMTYWDWTLDWQDILNAPVWGSGDLAFGTDGKIEAGVDVLNGNCVADGPFAGLSVRYSNRTEVRHCLSRGFISSQELDIFASRIKPQAIEHLILATAAPNGEPFFNLISLATMLVEQQRTSN